MEIVYGVRYVWHRISDEQIYGKRENEKRELESFKLKVNKYERTRKKRLCKRRCDPAYVPTASRISGLKWRSKKDGIS